MSPLPNSVGGIWFHEVVGLKSQILCQLLAGSSSCQQAVPIPRLVAPPSLSMPAVVGLLSWPLSP